MCWGLVHILICSPTPCLKMHKWSDERKPAIYLLVSILYPTGYFFLWFQLNCYALKSNTYSIWSLSPNFSSSLLPFPLPWRNNWSSVRLGVICCLWWINPEFLDSVKREKSTQRPHCQYKSSPGNKHPTKHLRSWATFISLCTLLKKLT